MRFELINPEQIILLGGETRNKDRRSIKKGTNHYVIYFRCKMIQNVLTLKTRFRDYIRLQGCTHKIFFLPIGL